MFESTLREQPPQRTDWAVVYDSRDGKVVHIHQFIGGDARISEKEARKARAQIALQVAEQHCDSKHLRVMLAPPNFHLEPGAMCRVDLASGELVQLMEPQYSLREFVERAQAGTAAKGIGGKKSEA